uniref:Uncharacterized protein n=1 Tax=Anser cygnoides TaxID=8845 RepID=A0A8B9E9X9_ANSCY
MCPHPDLHHQCPSPDFPPDCTTGCPQPHVSPCVSSPLSPPACPVAQNLPERPHTATPALAQLCLAPALAVSSCQPCPTPARSRPHWRPRTGTAPEPGPSAIPQPWPPSSLPTCPALPGMNQRSMRPVTHPRVTRPSLRWRSLPAPVWSTSSSTPTLPLRSSRTSTWAPREWISPTAQARPVQQATSLESMKAHLLQQLEVVKCKKAVSGERPGKAPAPPGDMLTFELYWRPEQDQFSQAASIAELEKRLAQLEVMVQYEPDSQETVQILQAKVNILDMAVLDQVEARLQSVLQKVIENTEHKAIVLDPETQSKIHQVHEMMQHWDPVASSLPDVVQRLLTLRDLHEEGPEDVKGKSGHCRGQFFISKSPHQTVAAVRETQSPFGHCCPPQTPQPPWNPSRPGRLFFHPIPK